MTDPYKTLGLGREASAAEIKSAYRKLAKKHHPDLNPGNAERFKNITGAYDILSNPEKKKKFDRGQLDPATGAERPGAGFGASGVALKRLVNLLALMNLMEPITIYFQVFSETLEVIFMGVLKPAVTEKTRRRKITSPKTQITNLLCLLPRPR